MNEFKNKITLQNKLNVLLKHLDIETVPGKKTDVLNALQKKVR